MILKRIQKQKHNVLLALFLIFTVLPVKLNLSSITIVITLVVSLLSVKKIDLQQNKTIFFISIPFLIYVLGLVNTENLEQGFSVLLKNLSFVAFPLIFFLNANKKINAQFIYKAYLLGLFFTNIYLIYLFVYYFNFGERFYKIVTLDIYHSTYLGMYNLFAFWIIILKLKFKPKGVFFALFFLFCAVLTASRIIFLGSFISLLVLIFIKLKGINKIIAPILLAFVFAFMLYKVPSFKQKFQQLIEIETIDFDKTNYLSISSRIAKIKAAKSLINKNRLLGTGTGDMLDELVKEYKKMGFTMGYKYRYNTHNQYLDNIIRNGIVGGLICLICLYFYPLTWAINNKNKLLLAFTLIIGFISMTESILNTHKGITFVAFFMSFLFCQSNKLHPKC